jgi:hypothetical protein
MFNAALLALAGAALAACGGDDDAGPVMQVDPGGTSSIDLSNLVALLSSYPLEPLSAAEAQSLAYMREEEQLAHDVYAVSATLWSPPVFANIAASEATHSAAVKVLLDRYQQPDPLAGVPGGSFPTPAFQALYDTMVATSRVSLIEALKIGVQIEELDIRDITAQKASIDNADILTVYDHLLRGSRNHLRAFMKVLTERGGTYVPQYISQAEFDAIVGSAIETGR